MKHRIFDQNFTPNKDMLFDALKLQSSWMSYTKERKTDPIPMENMVEVALDTFSDFHTYLYEFSKTQKIKFQHSHILYSLARDRFSELANIPADKTICYWRSRIELFKSIGIEKLQSNQRFKEVLVDPQNRLYVNKQFEELARLPLRIREQENPIKYDSLIQELKLNREENDDGYFVSEDIITRKSVLYNKIYTYFSRGFDLGYSGFSKKDQCATVLSDYLIPRCGNAEFSSLHSGIADRILHKKWNYLEPNKGYEVYITGNLRISNQTISEHKFFVLTDKNGLNVISIRIHQFLNFIKHFIKHNKSQFTNKLWAQFSYKELDSLINVWAKELYEDCGYAYSPEIIEI